MTATRKPIPRRRNSAATMKLFATIENPLCEIWQGDCRAIIASNQNEWKEAFDFIFADPPFNIGHGYDEYNDKVDEDSFNVFMLDWIGCCVHCLRDGGVMVVHVPDELVWLPLMALRPDTSGMTRIDWVIWHYRFAVNQSIDTAKGFLSSKAHGLVFRKGDVEHTFNAKDIVVPSDRASKYNDSRIHATVNGGQRLPFDVWDEFPRVQGNNRERLSNHPNQLPERYLERLIKAYTNRGNYCFDPFGGTGTTAVVSRELGRGVVTCEYSAAYCDDIANRLLKGAINV